MVVVVVVVVVVVCNVAMLSGVVVFLPGLQMSSVSTPGPQLAPHQGVSKPAADTILEKKLFCKKLKVKSRSLGLI